jgi:two-component system chemotaxis response regulator CheB
MDAIVVIAASAGGLEPLRRIIAALPVPCTASVFVVMHIGSHPSVLPSLLARAGALPAAFAEDGASIEAGHIYVAPPDHHMLLEPVRIRLSRGPKVHSTRPAADPLFVSAAEACGERVIGIVLSGGGSDGATGLRAIKEHGGTALVLHPEDAAMPFMPRAAIAAGHPDACLPVQEIVQFVGSFCSRYRTLPSGFHHQRVAPEVP